MVFQRRLFDLPPAEGPGWLPEELRRGAQPYWAEPEEIEDRFDATHYVVAQRPGRLLATLRCPLAPLTDWVEFNPPDRRLPVERGYLLFDRCCYAEIRHIQHGYWAVGSGLPAVPVRELPAHAAYLAEPGDVLLPRFLSSLHKAVIVGQVTAPLAVSENLILFHPDSAEHGLVLLALMHHRVLGEQLWALAAGTMKRGVSAHRLAELRAPVVEQSVCSYLAERVKALLELQRVLASPKTELVLPSYWQDGTLAQRRYQAGRIWMEIESLIVGTLGTRWSEEARWTLKTISAS